MANTDVWKTVSILGSAKKIDPAFDLSTAVDGLEYLEQYKYRGDEAGDAYVQSLGLPLPKQLYERFKQDYDKGVPEAVTLKRSADIPDSLDYGSIQRGRKYFWERGPIYLWAFLANAPVGNFSNPYVLDLTEATSSYRDPKMALRRNLDTFQGIIDYLDNSRGTPFTTAWEGLIRIRLLHSKVRVYAKRFTKVRSVGRMPVSQYDQLGIALGIVTEPMLVLLQAGIAALPEQKEMDILQALAYSLHILGVEPECNPAMHSFRHQVRVTAYHLRDTYSPDERFARYIQYLTAPLPYPMKQAYFACLEEMMGKESCEMAHVPKQGFAGWSAHRLTKLIIKSYDAVAPYGPFPWLSRVGVNLTFDLIHYTLKVGGRTKYEGYINHVVT